MRKISSYLITFFISCLVMSGVKANTIDSINMKIYIDANGTAHVTETWDASLSQGTEGYRSYSNLGNAVITNFKVGDNRMEYKDIGRWKTYVSFDEKAYKSGINTTRINFLYR